MARDAREGNRVPMANLLHALHKTALSEPKSAVILVIFGLLVLSALARLIGLVALLVAVGAYSKPPPSSFSPFLKSWIRGRLREQKGGGAGGGGASGIMRSMTSAIAGLLDSATASLVAAAHSARFVDLTCCTVAALYISDATANAAALQDAPAAIGANVPPRSRELVFVGVFGTWLAVPNAAVGVAREHAPWLLEGGGS